MNLSIVSTLYNKSRELEEFCARVSKAAGRFYDDYEIVLVNDGSPDESRDIALRLMERDPRIVLVDLSRNFGHHKAMMAGLEHAGNERVFLIDSDLEEEPEILETLHERFEAAQDCDVVYAYQKERKGSWLERASGSLFYKLFNLLSDVKFVENPLTARLMSRRYVQALLCFRERELVIGGIWVLAGFNQIGVPAVKHDSSPSAYTFMQKLIMMINSVTSFSVRPLYLISILGFVMAFVSLLGLVYIILLVMTAERPVPGWASVAVSIWFLGGLNIMILGVIGTYVAKTFIESKDRPLTIVKAVHRHHVGGTPPSSP